ncbi:MAG: LacI family DNA-binding transcriptional regulator [Capsulimonadaceae bacterium]|nr:LacI family DNA-binding transcriptional regulator [Capsulimonadaceae bacterium]
MPTQETTKRVTLKQVADLANVSVPAASTVLSGLTNSVRVPKQTQDRIREAAETLGYQTRSSRLKRQSVEGSDASTGQKLLHVGVITEYDTGIAFPSAARNPWEHDISTGIELAFAGSGRARARFFNRRRVNERPIPVLDAVSALAKNGVDALVVIDFDQIEFVSNYIPALEAYGLPFVVVSAGPLSAPVANVCYDNRAAGYMAASHLIELGHREIMFLSTFEVDWGARRVEGIVDAMRVYGVPASCFSIYPAVRKPYGAASDFRAVPVHTPAALAASKAAIDEGISATAVIGVNDEVALAFMKTAKEIAPGDRRYAVVGFDDIPEARFQSLTTFRAPREAMGREAASLALQLCGDPGARKQICLQSDLMIRSSTVEFV